jgi:iron(III) transport system ATP-binding protein
MPGIALRDVRKSYGSYTAVTGLDLTVKDGEFLCLLGPSGCGKTTTLRMIAGLENLTGGALTVGDRLVDCPAEAVFVAPEKRGMGLVFQSYALWPHMTIEENTEFGLKLRKMPKADRAARTTEVMRALGIEAHRSKYPSQLSGGQQQRVALARMLAVNPEVLLLDEPLSNLDARLRLEMRAELKRIHAEFNTTIVFVTHDQWEAMTLADTIAVMHEGKIQQVGSPDDIYERPANRFVAEFVGSPPINIVELTDQDAVVTAMQAFLDRTFPRSAPVRSVGIRPESLRIRTADSVTDAAAFSVPGRVAGVLPTGGSWIVEIATGARTLFLNTHVAPGVRQGDPVRVEVAAAALNLFDAAGDRIRESGDTTTRHTA